MAHVHVPQAPPMKMDELPLRKIPWALGATPIPHSQANMTPRLSLDQVAAIAARNRMLTYQLALPSATCGVFTALHAPGASEYLRSDLAGQRTLHIDQYSGEILKDVRFADYKPVAKAITFGAALHLGEYFGLANQLICAAIS